MERRDAREPSEPTEIPATHQYRGDVGIAPVLRNETDTRASVVRFWPGGRTGWHSHVGDQLLVITAGDGMIVNANEVLRATAGTVVRVPAGEPHWHGARVDTGMTHLAISTGESSYTRAVEDDEHAAADRVVQTSETA
jgi:quercetin dioxygenase-like cupin family protein